MAECAAGAAPLRLKDLLELDCDSCSAAGFRCYPRRLLCESPAPAAMRHLLDSPSLSSLRRPRRPSKLSSLSRSLSRRLGGRGGLFWRRRGEDVDEEEDAAAAGAAPSGSGSESGSSSTETATSDSSSSAGRSGSRCESDSDFSTATSSASDGMDAAAAVAAGDEHEATKRGSRPEADDKEDQLQLSPVAVMDFPSDDDCDGDADGGERDAAAACSPSFSLARLQRRKMLRPQHKIRRFGSVEELGPADLESRLAAASDTDDLAGDVPAQRVVIQCSTGDAAAFSPRPSGSHRGAGVVRHEPDEHALLALLTYAGADHVSGRLLLDFFVEAKRRRGPGEHPEEILAAARGWLHGAGSERWGLDDVLRGGEAVLAEMERARRWMRAGEEEREVGAVVAGTLADQLLDEVVWDFAACVGLYHWF